MSPNATGGFGLTVALEVSIAGLDQAAAEDIVQAAHAICPYSNAIKGNVPVTVSVTARP
jgi:osmotically inducible protein OsmC